MKLENINGNLTINASEYFTELAGDDGLLSDLGRYAPLCTTINGVMFSNSEEINAAYKGLPGVKLSGSEKYYNVKDLSVELLDPSLRALWAGDLSLDKDINSNRKGVSVTAIKVIDGQTHIYAAAVLGLEDLTSKSKKVELAQFLLKILNEANIKNSAYLEEMSVGAQTSDVIMQCTEKNTPIILNFCHLVLPEKTLSADRLDVSYLASVPVIPENSFNTAPVFLDRVSSLSATSESRHILQFALLGQNSELEVATRLLDSKHKGESDFTDDIAKRRILREQERDMLRIIQQFWYGSTITEADMGVFLHVLETAHSTKDIWRNSNFAYLLARGIQQETRRSYSYLGLASNNVLNYFLSVVPGPFTAYSRFAVTLETKSPNPQAIELAMQIADADSIETLCGPLFYSLTSNPIPVMTSQADANSLYTDYNQADGLLKDPKRDHPHALRIQGLGHTATSEAVDSMFRSLPGTHLHGSPDDERFFQLQGLLADPTAACMKMLGNKDPMINTQFTSATARYIYQNSKEQTEIMAIYLYLPKNHPLTTPESTDPLISVMAAAVSENKLFVTDFVKKRIIEEFDLKSNFVCVINISLPSVVKETDFLSLTTSAYSPEKLEYNGQDFILNQEELAYRIVEAEPTARILKHLLSAILAENQSTRDINFRIRGIFNQITDTIISEGHIRASRHMCQNCLVVLQLLNQYWGGKLIQHADDLTKLNHLFTTGMHREQSVVLSDPNFVYLLARGIQAQETEEATEHLPVETSWPLSLLPRVLSATLEKVPFLQEKASALHRSLCDQKANKDALFLTLEIITLGGGKKQLKDTTFHLMRTANTQLGEYMLSQDFSPAARASQPSQKGGGGGVKANDPKP